MSKIFKILSIDGGGIKGIYSAAFLAKLEELSDKKIVDCFDLICGTSTGGLIALFLGAGYSPSEIVDFYKENAKIIFPQKKYNLFDKLRGIPKFDNEELEQLLKQYFKDKCLKDSVANLCIPAVDADNEEPIVFKTAHSEKYKRDPEISLVAVGLATSAAPTYFPKYNVEKINRNTVDGGLSANNPSLIGVVEAMSLFVGSQKNYEKFSLLSIGNTEKNTGCFDSFETNIFKQFRFIEKLIDLFMKLQNKTTSNMVGLIAEATGSTYKRVANNNFTMMQNKQIQLDSSQEKVLDLLIQKGYFDAEHNFKDIENKKLLDTKNVLLKETT